MGFTERLEKQPIHGSQVPCTAGVWRASQTVEDRAEFDQALKSDASTVSIFRVMRDMGYPYGESAVRRHRSGECRCDIR